MVSVSVGNQGLWVKCKLSSCHRRKLFVDLSGSGVLFFSLKTVLVLGRGGV